MVHARPWRSSIAARSERSPPGQKPPTSIRIVVNQPPDYSSGAPTLQPLQTRCFRGIPSFPGMPLKSLSWGTGGQERRRSPRPFQFRAGPPRRPRRRGGEVRSERPCLCRATGMAPFGDHAARLNSQRRRLPHPVLGWDAVPAALTCGGTASQWHGGISVAPALQRWWSGVEDCFGKINRIPAF